MNATAPSLTPDAIHVRLYPDIALAARQRGGEVARDCETWIMLRALDTAGGGHLPADQAARGLRTVFGFSRAAVSKRLHRARPGLFWRPVRRRDGGCELHLTGAAAAARALGLDRLRLRPVDLPARQYRTLRDRRAAVLRAWLGARLDGPGGTTSPLSERWIARRTGISRAAQRRYRAAGIVPIANVGEANHDPYPHQPGRTVYAPHRRYFVRLPNSYRVPDAVPGGHQAVTRRNRTLANQGRAGTSERRSGPPRETAFWGKITNPPWWVRDCRRYWRRLPTTEYPVRWTLILTRPEWPTLPDKSVQPQRNDSPRSARSAKSAKSAAAATP